MKCYGEFICPKCGTVTKRGFVIRHQSQIEQLYSTCECGTVVTQYIPVEIRKSILSLAAKGYRILSIDVENLSIEFAAKFPDILLKQLGLCHGYEISNDNYTKISCIYPNDEDRQIYVENLLDWARSLPTLSHGVMRCVNEVTYVGGV